MRILEEVAEFQGCFSRMGIAEAATWEILEQDVGPAPKARPLSWTAKDPGLALEEGSDNNLGPVSWPDKDPGPTLEEGSDNNPRPVSSPIRTRCRLCK